MKTSKLYLFACIALLIISCKKDDAIELIVPEKKDISESETENEGPTLPILNFPELGEELVSLTPIFDWQESVDPESDAISYNLHLGIVGNPLNSIANNITTTDFITDTPLLRDATYQWRVDAIDAKGKSKSSEIFTFSTESSLITKLIENASFSKRKAAALTVYKNKIWLIGGEDESGNALADIWSSEDGINWNLETNNATFGVRKGHAIVEFQNKLWIYSGSSDTQRNNEVWSSEDGANWVLEANDHPWDRTPFYGQNSTTMFVFDNKIWRFAAYNGYVEQLSKERNIWNSTDGKNWTLVKENHGFDRKYGMKVIPFQGKLIALEGYSSGDNSISKVRQSINATDWETLSESLPFNIGIYSDAVVLNEKLFVTGGMGYNDLWFTADGTSWQKAVNQRNYPVKSHNSSVVYKNKIFIIGGNLNEVSNDVWIID